MKTYREFHGELKASNIGKRLREIVKQEKSSFKLLTGYGSTTGISKSKAAAIKSLMKMKKEGLIEDYFPGEIKTKLLDATSQFRNAKLKYESLVKSDPDYGNDGVIFVFLK